ncbi:MAG: glycogen debranching enzyme N-terminal domain-containing protein [Rikenellaceae bacterium]
MAALTFDKSELGNLEYSLTREILATDRRGGYMSTTIVGCNTRKYHGLIVAPIDESDRDYVLLSSLDETIILDGQRFNLALHRFRDIYEPRGHKYITDFEYTPTPTITYRIGDVVLRKELLWIHKRTQLMVRYTLVSGDVKSLTLQLRPFLAYRDRHALSKANMDANGIAYPVAGGVKCKLYDGFPWLYMQTDRDDVEFVPAPDWYYDFEYLQELDRGYDGYEDLLTPGYFEVEMKRGETIIFSASTDEIASSKSIEEDYETSIKRRTHKIDFLSCLEHSARQFIVRRPNGMVEVVAGYPWYNVVGREMLMSLPGLTLTQGHKEDCVDVLDSTIRSSLGGYLTEGLQLDIAADGRLWMYRAFQMLEKEIGAEQVWERYNGSMKRILKSYCDGTSSNVCLHDNGLIWAWSNDRSITWMDTTIDSVDAKPRNGYHVEVNALWYNAVCYTLSLAEQFGDKEFVKEWSWVPERTKSTFQSLFWLGDGWLADYVNHDMKSTTIRPNMIVACALDYTMLSDEQVVSVIRSINQHLLTTKGLRSLSPLNISQGFSYSSNSINSAPKNGSVWVWPLSMYVRSCFKIMGAAYVPDAEKILDNFVEEIQNYGLASVGEYFDAAPPHAPRGAISQAWSVASLLEISQMIKDYGATVKKKRTTRSTKKITK